MKTVEGNKAKSEVTKEKGKVVDYDSSYGGSGKEGECDLGLLSPMVAFEAGRTIELKRFEFCRIKLGLRVRYEHEKDEVKGAIREFILKMVEREEAGVEGKEYKGSVSEKSASVISGCKNRYIYVAYGLTLKAAKEYESHQVDIIEEIPVSDDADIFAAFEELSDQIAAELDEERTRIKSKETGL